MSPVIRPLTTADWSRFQAHFKRHRGESGRGEPHFLPFAPDDPEGPKGIDREALGRSLTQPGWQRCWGALTHDDEIVGHVDLKGGGLSTERHRCELGIGIERCHRGGGLGRRLMQQAIDFARGVESLVWIDLRVFAHNEAGKALYRDLGFSEVGRVVDRFRIEEQAIDDVIMTLRVGPFRRRPAQVE